MLCRRVAAAIAAVVLVTSCSSGSSSDEGATTTAAPTTVEVVTTTAAEPAESTPPADAELTAIVATMRDGGITVVADDELAGATAIPVAMPAWQAMAQAQQVAIGGGLPGQVLRERFPMPDDAVPIDALIAAWLTMDLPGATAARRLLDEPVVDDPARFTYPWAVVNLFVKDLTEQANGPQSLRRMTRPAPLRSDGPCGAVQDFYRQTIGATIAALEGSDSLLGQIAGQALDLFVDVLGEAVSAAVPAAVKVIVQAVGVAAAIAAAVEPWSATLVAEPTSTAKGIAPAVGNAGSVRLVVVTGTDDWPAPVKACASLGGIELPQLDPAGAAVTWSLTAPDLADETARESAVTAHGDQYEARFEYVTRVETVGPNAQSFEGTMVVDGQVTRNDRDTMIKLLGTMVGTALKGLPQAVVVPLAAKAATEIAGLLDITDPVAPVSVIPVTFHFTPQDATGSTLPALTVSDTQPEQAGCVGVVLTSEGRGGAAGVLLRLDADHTGVFDFGQAEGYNGAVVRGLLTFTWSGGPEVFDTTAGEGMLGVLVVIGGATQLIELSPGDIAAIAQPETLQCQDGAITIARTGEVYS